MHIYVYICIYTGYPPQARPVFVWGGRGGLMACTCLHGSGTCSPQLATSPLASSPPVAPKVFKMPCQIKVEHTSLTQLARAKHWQGWIIPSLIAIMLGIDKEDKRWISPYTGNDVTWMTEDVTPTAFHAELYTLKGWVMERACFDQVWQGWLYADLVWNRFIGDELESETTGSSTSTLYFNDEHDATSSYSTDTFGSTGDTEEVWEDLWSIRGNL